MDIAIVGGGAAAVGLLDALAAENETPDAIMVFEPSGNWGGRPYGPDLGTVLVNSPPPLMSIRHSDFGHYSSWLGARGAAHFDELLGAPLAPREGYGEYLEHTADQAMAALRERGCRVRIVPARVTAATRAGTRMTVRTEDERAHVADRVVLCVGGGVPDDHYGLDGAPGFVRDPYPLARKLDRLSPDEEVAVLGSGLTAVDIVVSLAARGHTGPITLLSRSGVLPHVWLRPVERRPRHLTIERVAKLRHDRGGVTLDDLTGLLRAELVEAGEDFDEFTAELLATETDDPVERLRTQLDAVADPRIGRRFLQEAAHVVGHFAWPLLPEVDRRRLLRHSRTALSLASPMVPVNAAILLGLFDSGQLTIAAGTRGIEPVDGAFLVHHGDLEHKAGTVINAVNPAPHAIARTAAELVDSLLADGTARPQRSGGLVPTDPRLHMVGDLAGGSFITPSIPGIAAQAAEVAKQLTTRRL